LKKGDVGEKAWFYVDFTANGKNLKNVKEVFNRNRRNY
jgi:hypothetical protein